MLSDEEKKAIKVVNKRTERLIEELKIEEEDLIDEPKIAYLITQIEANKTLVNLIEKQSKEIEELNKSDESKEQSSMKYYNLYKELVDKIKAKIEEVSNGTYDAKIVLQSLLEYIEDKGE